MNSYIKQFEFELWSNTTILKALRNLNAPDERAITLFSHLLSSHRMWWCRMNKKEIDCALFQERTLDECEALMHLNAKEWKSFLSTISDSESQQEMEFFSAWETNPTKRSITVEDALVHLINHSSYHRGQIVASIKGKVEELPLSTYIIYSSKILA